MIPGGELNPGAAHLWCASPDDLLAQERALHCAELLADDERVRSRQFRFERHRREYLATRALVRSALSRHRPLPPADWRFARNVYGKPRTVPACGLGFNLSNSPRLVVCLVARNAAVGVDTEPFERAAQIAELAPEVFSPPELAEFELLQGHERLERALSLWTLKESYIKARGMGLALPLDRFSFLFGEGASARLVTDPSLGDDPRRWQFGLLDHAGHRIAYMVEGPRAPELQLHEIRLPGTCKPSSAPRRVCAAPWLQRA